jgi:hypothetical protein
MAIKQWGIQRCLKVGQPLAHGRCCDEFPFGGAPNAALFAHCNEKLQ